MFVINKHLLVGIGEQIVSNKQIDPFLCCHSSEVSSVAAELVHEFVGVFRQICHLLK